MKKVVGITTGVVVIAVAGWLGTTWYTGKRIESEEPARLTQLNEQLAKALASTGVGVQIDRLSYDRHFFSSDAHYGIKITQMPGDEAAPEGMVEVIGHIEHGPFAKSAIAQGQWMPKLAFIHTEIAQNETLKPVFELTNGVSPLSGNTIIAYNGDGVGTAEIPPIKFEKDGESVDFSGMQSEGTYERATKRTTGKLKTDKLAMNVVDSDDDRVQSEISGITMDIDSRMGQFGLSIGSSGIHVDSILLNIGQPSVADMQSDTPATPAAPAVTQKQIAIKDLGYKADLTEAGANLAVEASYNIGQIMVDGDDYGKGNTTIRFDKIDGKAAKALSDIYNELLADMASAKADNDASTARLLQAANHAIQLLEANPSLRVDPFVWETAQGQSNLKFELGLTKPKGLVAAQGLQENPKKLIQQAISLIDLQISVSKPMLQGLATQYLQSKEGLDADAAKKGAEEQVNSVAGMAEMFGFAKTDGDNIVSKFHYADGKADLNGEDVPADQLFAMVLGNLDDRDDEEDMDENAMLGSFDPEWVGNLVSSVGYSYRLEAPENDAPSLIIDATEEGVQDAIIRFNDCSSASSCTEMQMYASVATPQQVPMSVLNAWNQEHRGARAYWDTTNNVAVLEMNVSALGGIGQNNVEYAVDTFLGSLTGFIDAMQSTPAN